MIKIFRPLRAKHQSLQNDLKEAKRKYDSVLAGLEAGRGNLEREVSQVRFEIFSDLKDLITRYQVQFRGLVNEKIS